MSAEIDAALERAKANLAAAQTPEDKALWEAHVQRFETVKAIRAHRAAATDWKGRPPESPNSPPSART